MADILSARARGRLAPIRFEHAGIRTSRLPQLTDWYTTVLQAEVVFANETMAFLAYDERNHRLVIINRPGTVDRIPNSAGLDHLAFAYEDLDELLLTYERLHSAGIMPQRVTDHGCSISFYYTDPDGNQIELKVDTIHGPEGQYEWFRGAEFAANPLGVAINPDELLSARSDRP